jgi:hypothetical protein
MITQHRGFQWPHPEGFFQMTPKKRVQRDIGILCDGRVHEAESGNDCEDYGLAHVRKDNP